MQTKNTQSAQKSDFQQTVPIQSETTQPRALNPNQLDQNTSLTVTGPRPTVSNTQPEPAGDPIWPLVLLGIVALAAIVAFAMMIVRILRTPDPNEDSVIDTLPTQRKPAKKTKKNKPKNKKRR